MNIHEYQAKELLKSYGVPVPAGEVVYSDRAAARVAEELGGVRWVVKAQIHAGGRGKGGGVKVANSVEKVAELADQMIGSTLVTAQTGAEGKRVHRVLVERASRIDREFYATQNPYRLMVAPKADSGRAGDLPARGAAARHQSGLTRVSPDPVCRISANYY